MSLTLINGKNRIISIHVEKAFDKIQPPFMTKVATHKQQLMQTKKPPKKEPKSQKRDTLRSEKTQGEKPPNISHTPQKNLCGFSTQASKGQAGKKPNFYLGQAVKKLSQVGGWDFHPPQQ